MSQPRSPKGGNTRGSGKVTGLPSVKKISVFPEERKSGSGKKPIIPSSKELALEKKRISGGLQQLLGIYPGRIKLLKRRWFFGGGNMIARQSYSAKLDSISKILAQIESIHKLQRKLQDKQLLNEKQLGEVRILLGPRAKAIQEWIIKMAKGGLIPRNFIASVSREPGAGKTKVSQKIMLTPKGRIAMSFQAGLEIELEELNGLVEAANVISSKWF
ncbi:hypothetical protein KKE06_00740 [Candidatus Micrarchaeota archaeon]|nr:hypothetical protein [Candidatus Micrarchaeota archaeon]MBU1930133.1 hypothetical protein [Candidatus Micrarchaeota archaeon]